MTQKQFENIVKLCKGNDVLSIRKVLAFYRPTDIKELADKLGVTGDDHDLKDKLAFALANHA